MARPGFTGKEAAIIIRVHPSRIWQSLDPSGLKIGLLWRHSASAATKYIDWCVEQYAEPMSDLEIDLLIRRQRGRLDR